LDLPIPAAPLEFWPRAAGGGAGGVVAPAVVTSERLPEWPPMEPQAAAAAPDSAPMEEPPAAMPLPDATGQIEPPAAAPTATPATEHSPSQPVEATATIAHPADAVIEPVPELAMDPPPVEAVSILAPAPAQQQPIEAMPVRGSVEPSALPQPLPEIWRTVPPPATWKEPLPRPARDKGEGARRYLRQAVAFASIGLLALAALLLGLIVLYRWVDPPTSTLMLGQRLAGYPITQRWVPLERISPNLLLAAIISEDGHFCRHRGVDWGELREAIESAGDGIPRGGSTISMQVVKNLFLWPSKSYLRKAIEIPLAYAIEAAWSKRRILEIYLNIAEWGPGIFGAEAAARYHFRKPALLLNAREAALLAVSLPNPFEREAGSPGPGTARLADNLLLRMRAAQGSAATCVRASRPGA
jgi:monofunctional glycosyltransferase